MSRSSTIPLALPFVLALLVGDSAALAHGGAPHDEPTREQLMGTDGPATTPPTNGDVKRAQVVQVANEKSETGGVGERQDDEQAWARAQALGMGYLEVPATTLNGFRLAPESAHLVLAVDTVASTNRGERAFDSFGVALLAYDGDRFDWGLGQLVLRESELAGARSTALNVGFVRYHEDLRIGAVRLELTAHLTANLVQETVSQSPLLRSIEDGLRPCSTQSEIGLSLRLHLDARVAMAVFAIDQDDPFHFTSGAECLGDGAVWSQSSKAGSTVEIQLGRGLVLSGGITWATAAIGYDLEMHRHGMERSGQYRNTNVEMVVALAWHE